MYYSSEGLVGKRRVNDLLDFTVTKESDCRFIGSSPELSLCQVKRIIEADNRVKLLGQNLKVCLGF